MKSLIVAVSGGVDSVVLLDKLVKLAAEQQQATPVLQGPTLQQGWTLQTKNELIVAHFDHGIRPESDADARFVEGLAKQYGLQFEGMREELGRDASEATARARRYAFLRSVAKKHDGLIATAHHQDDVIETIAINCQRGTGWRGLAVLDSDIVRPLLMLSKQDIRTHALEHKLEWVEDETNAEDTYLRNRMRAKINQNLSPKSKAQLVKLWEAQRTLKQVADKETEQILEKLKEYTRYFFTHIDETSALELLRAILLRNNASLTRPQRQRLLHAIKVAKAGSRLEAGEGVTVRFTQTTFIVETLPSVV